MNTTSSLWALASWEISHADSRILQASHAHAPTIIITALVAVALYGLWLLAVRISFVKELYTGIKILPSLIWMYISLILGSYGNSVDLFMYRVRWFPNKEALVFTADNRRFTYIQLNQEINKAVHFLLSQEVKHGTVVALMIDNSPEFIIFWMACLKIGAAAAFINTNTKGASLVHAISAGSPVCIIISEKYSTEIQASFSDYEAMNVFVLNPQAPSPFKHANYTTMSDAEPSAVMKSAVKVTDVAMLIYTSGTTGKPKPALMNHARLRLASAYFSSYANITSKDRIYCCLPLYHSNGALVGWGSTMMYGCTLVISPKYSSTKFLNECIEHKATAVLYIGELARFLINTPESPSDQHHSIRIAMGNGLRPDVWPTFKTRFNIPEVCEFYASTEGNAQMVNHQTGTTGIGAVGRLGPFFQAIMQIYLVKFDHVNEEPLRDKHGRCVVCKPGETGELIAMISQGSLIKSFKGYYNNKEATSKKVITNVFKNGDCYFRTGDLLTRDANYNYYFADRIGDSFRWKGENVSTFEVAEQMCAFPEVVEANVYGVQICGMEGCAGMAAVRLDSDSHLEGLAAFLRARLPKYAVPVFVRVLPSDSDTHTATFKQVKHVYRNEGFDPRAIRDSVYWLKPGSSEYGLLSDSEYDQISNGLAVL
ncbi:Fatty-acid-CoA ligase FadD6 [Chytriomyces hyalinus]|nr:Fatty-acid-CoA ligase FadD6 [Chytriomyces hyalinus]